MARGMAHEDNPISDIVPNKGFIVNHKCMNKRISYSLVTPTMNGHTTKC